MADSYYGKTILGSLSAAQTLPSGTDEDSESVVYIGGHTGGQLWINVYAHTAISIADTADFTIEVEGYTAATAQSSFTSPYSITNGGGSAIGGSGTSEDNAHYNILWHLGDTDGQLDFNAGDLMTQCAIPEDMFRLLSYDYVQLHYLTTGNESSETVDAFVWIKPS